MSELEYKKVSAIQTLASLCPRCERGEEHSCPVAALVKEVRLLRPVPINVNDKLYSVVFLS